MTAIEKSRVIVTPRVAELQLELLRGNGLPVSEAASPKLSLSPHHAKSTRSTSTSSLLPPYFFPTRAGYFGPKGPKTSTPACLTQSVSKEYSLYPNYLKRDAKEYPPKHICVWKPKSTVQGTEKMGKITPLGKSIHHTLFNETFTKIPDSPKIDQLNTITYGKAMPVPINLSAEFKNWNPPPKDGDMGMHKSTSLQTTQTNFYTTRFGSTGFSKFSVNSTKEDEAKGDRVLKKCIENEKNFQKLLIRFDEEAKRKLNRYQENQHEAPEFEKKMKEQESTLVELASVKSNEDARFAARLKTLQKQKYEPFWKTNQGFYDKNERMSHREISMSKKEEEVSSHTLPFNSARERASTRESHRVLKLEAKKTSFVEEPERYVPVEPKIKRKSEQLLMKRIIVK